MIGELRTGAKLGSSCLRLVDTCLHFDYIAAVIKTFRHKGLAELWSGGRARRIDHRLCDRILRLLDRLDQAGLPQDMGFAGTQFHALKGFKPTRYTVHVNGPWCVTFEFVDGHAYEVDLEQYH